MRRTVRSQTKQAQSENVQERKGRQVQSSDEGDQCCCFGVSNSSVTVIKIIEAEKKK